MPIRLNHCCEICLHNISASKTCPCVSNAVVLVSRRLVGARFLLVNVGETVRGYGNSIATSKRHNPPPTLLPLQTLGFTLLSLITAQLYQDDIDGAWLFRLRRIKMWLSSCLNISTIIIDAIALCSILWHIFSRFGLRLLCSSLGRTTRAAWGLRHHRHEHRCQYHHHLILSQWYIRLNQITMSSPHLTSGRSCGDQPGLHGRDGDEPRLLGSSLRGLVARSAPGEGWVRRHLERDDGRLGGDSEEGRLHAGRHSQAEGGGLLRGLRVQCDDDGRLRIRQIFYTSKIPKNFNFTREKRLNRNIFGQKWKWRMF